MRFSYVMLPDYPLADSIETIKMADELGFYALLLRRRDVAQGPVAALRRGADKTKNIRFGPSLTPCSCASRR